MQQCIDRFYYLWALTVPITSFLLVPSIQGTVPAFMLAFASLFVVIAFGGALRGRYFAALGICVMVWLLFLFLSQLGNLTVDYTPPFGEVILVQPLDSTFVMRQSLFTQSLYLGAVVLYGVFMYVYYRKGWDRWLMAGALLMATFGILEVVWFAGTGLHLDVISNRDFSDDAVLEAYQKFQEFDIAGQTLLRMKGLTGEPSMYAFSMLPFWVYARVAFRSRWPARILGFSLILTMSTTAFLGFVCVLAMRMRRVRVDAIRALFALLVLSVLAYLLRDQLLDFYQHGILDKFQGQNDSGAERMAHFFASVDYWQSLPLLGQLFGVGFGYVRSTDMAGTLLVNNGIAGVLLFTFVFLYPVVRLDKSARSSALAQCLVAVYVMMMVSVPEFSYLAPWGFVAMAYQKLHQLQRLGLMHRSPHDPARRLDLATGRR